MNKKPLYILIIIDIDEPHNRFPIYASFNEQKVKNFLIAYLRDVGAIETTTKTKTNKEKSLLADKFIEDGEAEIIDINEYNLKN